MTGDDEREGNDGNPVDDVPFDRGNEREGDDHCDEDEAQSKGDSVLLPNSGKFSEDGTLLNRFDRGRPDSTSGVISFCRFAPRTQMGEKDLPLHIVSDEMRDESESDVKRDSPENENE